MADVSSCGKGDCRVSTTGVCAEGHSPLPSCPYYGQLEQSHAVAEDADLGDNLALNISRVTLSSGEALTVADVDEFLRLRGIILIAVVGDRDSGKTTLLLSLYERFLRGPFAGRSFAGSRTLVSLEKKSHYSRLDSGRAEADTARTPISEGLKFIHFGLGSQTSLSQIDLMLSDRAGETYRLARSDSKIVPELIEISKADRVLLLLDGRRIASAEDRAGAFQSVRQSVRALLDGDALGASSIVQVATTKADLLVQHPDNALIQQQVAAFKNRLSADFAGRLRELTFWETAARPRSHLPPAYGLEPLLLDWTASRRRPVPPAEIPVHLEAEFDRLLVRTSIEVLP